MEYLSDYVYFFGVAFVVLAAVLVYQFFNVGGLDRFKAYLKGEGKGAFGSAGLFIAVITVVTLLLFSASAMADYPKAGEAFKFTEVSIGVDYVKEKSPQCREGSSEDNLTSHGQIKQHLYSFTDNVFTYADYRHHSCVLGKDTNGYDSLGLGVTWRFNW